MVLILVLALVVGLAWSVRRLEWWDGFLGVLLALVAFCWLAVGSIMFVTSLGKCEEFRAVSETLSGFRESSDPLERAAMANKAADWNAWLADRRYWNSWFICDWSIPDAVNELEPIR